MDGLKKIPFKQTSICNNFEFFKISGYLVSCFFSEPDIRLCNIWHGNLYPVKTYFIWLILVDYSLLGCQARVKIFISFIQFFF